MATVSAMILFDALRQDVSASGRKSITSFSRQQLRDAMAAHPAWEGKAFEETSFNTVPEDLGEQLEQFSHEDYAGDRNYRFRFRGPTRKFREEKSSRELYLEVRSEPLEQKSTSSAATRRSTLVVVMTVLVIAIIASIATVVKRPHPAAVKPKNATLAVLPFRLLETDSELRFLEVGIADAVITRLSNVELVRVRPTTAILRYQNRETDLQRVGHELAADYLLSGTLQTAGDRIRAGVQLIHVDDGAAIWGEHFDLPRSDLLSLEDAIADRVALSLQPRLTGGQRARLSRRFTTNPIAYEHYLRGRAAILLLTQPATRQAIEEFDAAIRSDPSYALARAGLANAAAQMRIRFASKNEIPALAARAKHEAEEALRLAPDQAEAHEALAAVYRYDEFDWEKVMDESGRALALNPDLELAHDYRASAALHLGLLTLAEREARTSMDVNPQQALEPLRILGVSSLFAGRYSDAISRLREVARHSDIADYHLGLALYCAGQQSEADKLLNRLVAARPEMCAPRPHGPAFSQRPGAERKPRELPRVLQPNRPSITISLTVSARLMPSLGTPRKRFAGWTRPFASAFPAIRGLRAILCCSRSAEMPDS
jgi:TolB-like protein